MSNMDQSKIDRISSALREQEVERRRYSARVTTGNQAPDPMAYVPVGGIGWTADDVPTTTHAFNCGQIQGFQCTLGGGLEVPTPPIGLDRDRTLAFAQGVVAGEALARQGLVAGGTRSSFTETHFEDAFGDIPRYPDQR